MENNKTSSLSLEVGEEALINSAKKKVFETPLYSSSQSHNFT